MVVKKQISKINYICKNQLRNIKSKDVKYEVIHIKWGRGINVLLLECVCTALNIYTAIYIRYMILIVTKKTKTYNTYMKRKGKTIQAEHSPKSSNDKGREQKKKKQRKTTKTINKMTVRINISINT